MKKCIGYYEGFKKSRELLLEMLKKCETYSERKRIYRILEERIKEW